MCGQYEKIGQEIGRLVDKKNAQYGDAVKATDEFLKILFPDGIKPDQYADLGLLIRIYDKMKRIANGNKGEENAWIDITGYGILGASKNNE